MKLVTLSEGDKQWLCDDWDRNKERIEAVLVITDLVEEYTSPF